MAIRVKIAAAVLMSIAASCAAHAQGSIRDKIVGAWTLVSVEALRDDGSKSDPFGSNPKGIIVFTQAGQFSLFQSRADVPKLAANDRTKATPEEAIAVVAGTIAYFGTYVVDDGRSLSVTLEGSTYANLLGTEQKRLITSLTDDELRFTNPRTPSGVTLLTAWKRAK